MPENFENDHNHNHVKGNYSLMVIKDGGNVHMALHLCKPNSVEAELIRRKVKKAVKEIEEILNAEISNT